MSVWIRSQDKLTLEELNAVSAYRVYKNEGGYWHDYYDGLGDMDVYYSVGALGYYSSKEKAIKVLDMIQSFIEALAKVEITSNMIVRDNNNRIKNNMVFQMPLDEDIKL